MEENTQITLSAESMKLVDSIRKSITEKHKKVSQIKTTKAFIKKKQGMDYVELGYMKGIADIEYPGFSWTIVYRGLIGSEAYEVHGRLKWYDEGIWREGDMTAAHRIQKKRGTDEFVDIGNDIKSANTDCIKKAFNMYMNICDDVYRNQVEDPILTDKQKKDIADAALKVDMHDKVMKQVEDGDLNAMNFKASMAKLERMFNAK